MAKKIVMLKTAAGPGGVYRRGKAYIVDEKTFREFTDGEDPAAMDYSEAEALAAEVATETRGETPEGPAPQPTEIPAPKPPKRKGKK